MSESKALKISLNEIGQINQAFDIIDSVHKSIMKKYADSQFFNPVIQRNYLNDKISNIREQLLILKITVNHEVETK